MFKKSFIKLALFYTISILFILLNVYFIVKKDAFVISILPLALAVLLVIIFSVQRLIYLVVFFTPLSMTLREFLPGMPFDMYLPTEPLLFGILIVFGLKVLSERKFDKQILLHPVSVAILFHLIWIFLSCLTSTMPVVSFKFLLSRIWFVVGFYLIAAKIFEGGKNIEKYVWLYVLPLMGVVFYSTYRHLGYGLWDKQAAHFVVGPFYNDHTSYGALLAMYLPFVVGFTFFKLGEKKHRLMAMGASLVIFTGLILSYSRAAWLSVVIAFGVWAVIKLKIRFRTLVITFVSLVGFFLVFQTQIVMYLERNSEESSANFMEHISSMSNITTDASNMERINRWSCAIRMFKEKPVFGYGPGTYMFQYAPFQLKKDRTIISTNAGDGGNAHSEYLGPLAEQGLPGMLMLLVLIGVVIYSAIKTYSRATDQRQKMLIMGALTGLLTYYLHGLANNFLDTDKASVPFWGFTAMIVAIDLHNKNKAKKNPEQNGPDLEKIS